MNYRATPNPSWKIYFHSSEKMLEVEDQAAQIVIASPPFTNQPDGKTLDKRDYLEFIERVFCEIHRVLKIDGILITINTDLRDHARYNNGDSHYEGLVWQKHSDLRQIAEKIGFRCIDTKIWAKSLKRDLYRYTFSYIQFFEKSDNGSKHYGYRKTDEKFGPDVWLLERGTYRRASDGLIFRNAIHPEIVRRCLHQFTSPGDLVISPFTGSGTVLAVAHIMGRRSIGYEINRNLEAMIVESIETPSKMEVYQTLL